MYNNGRTPLHEAAARGDTKALQYLVSQGADDDGKFFEEYDNDNRINMASTF